VLAPLAVSVQTRKHPAARRASSCNAAVCSAVGRGYGTAAQEALAHYLFQTTLVERLEAGTDVDNLAEQRALEKAAFQREGVLRHAQYRRGQWHDLVRYGRLRDDPVQ